jgi:hypothetical protein
MGNCWPAEYSIEDFKDGDEQTIECFGIIQAGSGFLYFLEFTGGGGMRLLLSEKNVSELIDRFGEEPRNWSGKKIAFYPERTLHIGEPLPTEF